MCLCVYIFKKQNKTVKVDYLQEQDPRENLISSKNNRTYPNFAVIWETRSFAFLELLCNNLTRILNRKYDVKLQLLLVNVPFFYQV